MLLSATSPLLQAWYVRVHTGAIPYRLFALSNFGSFLALLSYPLVIEPRLALSRQAMHAGPPGMPSSRWHAASAAWREQATAAHPLLATDGRRGGSAAWHRQQDFLGGPGGLRLHATAGHHQPSDAKRRADPALWVVPLSIYLLSFILSFESGVSYQRWIFMPLLVGSLGLFARA